MAIDHQLELVKIKQEMESKRAELQRRRELIELENHIGRARLEEEAEKLSINYTKPEARDDSRAVRVSKSKNWVSQGAGKGGLIGVCQAIHLYERRKSSNREKSEFLIFIQRRTLQLNRTSHGLTNLYLKDHLGELSKRKGVMVLVNLTRCTEFSRVNKNHYS